MDALKCNFLVREEYCVRAVQHRTKRGEKAESLYRGLWLIPHVLPAVGHSRYEGHSEAKIYWHSEAQLGSGENGR